MQTHLDGNAGGNLGFSVVLSDPGADNIRRARARSISLRALGAGIIEKVCGEIDDLQSRWYGQRRGIADVGESVPMMVRLTSPDVVDGPFMLDYDTNCFKITTDAAGNNVVTPDTTNSRPAPAARSSIWGVGATSDRWVADYVGVRRRRPGQDNRYTKKEQVAGKWTPTDTWAFDSDKGTYSGDAQADGGPASLKTLAYDITGNEDDWKLLIPDLKTDGVKYTDDGVVSRDGR